MQIPLPRLSGQPAATRADLDSLLTAELASATAGARRRALRNGDRQIDTAHLLHSLIKADPEVRRLLGPGPHTARLLGYLVQRSIGYGLRWQGSVEDSGALPVVRETALPVAVRETALPGTAALHRATGAAGALSGVREAESGTPGWSPSAVAALEGALERARLRGEARACGVDLLVRLAADPGCRAVEVLRRAGVDADRLADQPAGLPADRVCEGLSVRG